MIKDREILQQAINKYGMELQEDVCIEECSELIKAIIKYRRKPTVQASEDVVDEIADVIIMVEQMAIIWGKEEVTERIDYKLARLNERINGGSNIG